MFLFSSLHFPSKSRQGHDNDTGFYYTNFFDFTWYHTIPKKKEESYIREDVYITWKGQHPDHADMF